jgi:phosphoribosylformylglycinamidine (FGAM) synthase PurS component
VQAVEQRRLRERDPNGRFQDKINGQTGSGFAMHRAGKRITFDLDADDDEREEGVETVTSGSLR